MQRNEQLINHLIDRSTKRLLNPIEHVAFSGNRAADELTNDLTHYPHAFLLGCLFDRQVKAEIAWQAPYGLYQRIGRFDIDYIASIDESGWLSFILNPSPLHRYAANMAQHVHAVLASVKNDYEGNAANIWLWPGWNGGAPSATEVMARFRALDGFGPKLSSMATNILVRDFKIKVSSLRGLDISVDTHVRRVFKRLGLSSPNAADDTIISLAREYHPIYPGALDLSIFEIGRNYCYVTDPDCHGCPVLALCARVQVQS